MSFLKKAIIAALFVPVCSFASGCCMDMYATADFIYWKVREEGLGFADTGSTVTDGISATNVNGSGSNIEPKFDWEPGFKVGLGLNFGCDNWDLYAQYTWLRTDPGPRSASRDPNEVLNTLKTKWHLKGTGPINDLIFASGKWKFDYNVFDFELGRRLCPTPCLNLRPFIGLKGAWFQDNYNVAYQLNETNFPRTEMSNAIDFWGVGLRAGFNSIWHFLNCFGIFGDVALTGLVSSYDVVRKDTTTPNAAVPNQTFLERNTSYDYYTLKGVLEFALGLRYDTCCCSCPVSVQVGWEEHLWLNFSKHYVLIEDFSFGDLALYGLTVRASVGF